MCKLFIATGKFTPSQTREMLRLVNRRFASSQRDGFGFVAYGPSGTAYGRYLNPKTYSGFGVEMPEFIDTVQRESGTLPGVVTAIVAHGRTSTNKVVVDNCHPFNAGNVYLAHNGVLDWEGPVVDEPSAKHDCDTEQFFNWVNKRRSKHRDWHKAFDDSHKHWSGYGVFGAIDAANGTLAVAKCGFGRLSWVGSKSAHLFSTDADDLEHVASVVGIKHNAVPVKPNTLTVYRAAGRIDIMSSRVWSGFASAYSGDNRIQRSMGVMTPVDASTVGNRPTVVQRGSGTSNPWHGISVPRDSEKESGSGNAHKWYRESKAADRELFPDYVPHGARLSDDHDPICEC